MNKTTTFILSLVVGALIGAVGYNLIHAATHTGSVITKQKGSDTYSNGTYGISFTYPDSYTLTETDANVQGQKRHTIKLISKADATPMNASSTTPGEEPTAITFDIFSNQNNTTVADWVKNTPESNFKISDGVANPASIAGVPAVTYTWDGLYRGNTIVFTHKNNIVMTSMTFLTYQDYIWKDFAGVIQSLKLQ